MDYEKALTIATILLLFGMGIVFLFSIIDYSKKSSEDGEWAGTTKYKAFMEKMDRMLFPFVVLFLVVLSLCIPKRILPGRYLMALSGGLIFLGAGLYFKDYRLALGVVLFIATLLQGIVLIYSIAGKKLEFLGSGYLLKVGSSLIHFGVVYFALSVVYPSLALIEPIRAFWISAIFITVGMYFIFYRRHKDTYYRGNEA